LVATGTGGFAATASLDAGLSFGSGSFWLSGALPYHFPYNADIAPGAFTAFDPPGPPRSLAGGRALLSRSPSCQASAGLGWEWFRSASAAHSLALEWLYLKEGAIVLDGYEVPETGREYLGGAPQARFSFGRQLSLSFGWMLPFGRYATNQAVAYSGEYLLRADYKL
jgi:hypothetical protein